jgi:hypothetical protein
MSGEVYNVIENGKKKATLRDWLTDVLRCRREEKAGAGKTPKEKQPMPRGEAPP